MFLKVGTKLKFIRDFKTWKKGEIVTIQYAGEIHENELQYVIILNDRNPKTEIEFLDCFKHNFSEGV